MAPESSGPLKRQGSIVGVFEVRCRRCKRGRLLTEGEAAPMAVGLVPFCHDCRQEGYTVQMRVTRYNSGPNTLIV